MPNIIEQQDLLKGLPDARLAMLLQNPVGDIPPFLVAAEAQRRQAIRQQFAGPDQKESVVDTLTKQMAKVPQNIKSNQSATPPVPPTPQMQGVMALQQQQAMQQAAQQAQQGMRRGGMVQRYQGAGFVQPVQDRVRRIADQFSISVEEAARMLERDPSIGGPVAESDLGKPPVIPDQAPTGTPNAEPFKIGGYTIGDMVGAAEDYLPGDMTFGDVGRMAFGAMYPHFAYGTGTYPAQVMQNRKEMSREEAQRLAEANTLYGGGGRDSARAVIAPYGGGARDSGGPARQPRTFAGAEPQTSATPTSSEREDLRRQLEELMAYQGPSDWEKAQKWFQMSAAFLEPDQSLGQSLVKAAQAFSEGSADESRAQREAEFAQKKAMLEYAMSDLERQEQLDAAARAERLDAYKLYASQAAGSVEQAVERLKSLERERADYIKNNTPDTGFPDEAPPDFSKDPFVIALNEQIRLAREDMLAAQGRNLGALGAYGQLTGTDPSITYFTGDGLAKR